VVTLVVNHQPDISRPNDVGQALLVKRANRADEHLGVARTALGGAFDCHDGGALERLLKLGPRLRQELFAMGEHQHLAPRELCQAREDHRLTGARRQAHHHPPQAGATGREHRFDGLRLIRPEDRRGRGHQL
jgi:hypothetical protein